MLATTKYIDTVDSPILLQLGQVGPPGRSPAWPNFPALQFDPHNDAAHTAVRPMNDGPA